MNKGGKEGFPTRAYEVTVSHDRQIRAIAGSFPGAWNDKTIARFDGFVQKVRLDPHFTRHEFRLRRQSDGKMTCYRGLYLLTDNGYHLWRCLIPPMPVVSLDDEVIWSKHLTSVRKDVECTFGSLKIRFKILKIPLRFPSIDKIDNIFYTCAILHNMLLHWDGLALMEREEGDPGYGDLHEEIVSNGKTQAGQHSSGYCSQVLHTNYDATRFGRDEMECHFLPPPDHSEMVEQDADFVKFRNALVDHYSWFRRRLHPKHHHLH